MVSQGDFGYTLSGDVSQSGRASSIIVANTPSIGALVVVGEKTPEDPTLELIINHGRSRVGFFARILGGLVRRKKPGAFDTYHVHKLRIETQPPVNAHADVADIGNTPVDILALPGGLHVILPA